MAYDGVFHFSRVVFRNGVLDIFHDIFRIALQHAHGMYERYVYETEFDVRDVHGHGVHDVFDQVRGHAFRSYRHHVQNRIRVHVPVTHCTGRNGVNDGKKHEQIRPDHVVFRHRSDGQQIVVRQFQVFRVLVHLAELSLMIQPKRDEKQNDALDQQTQIAEQFDGQIIFRADYRQVRRDEIKQSDPELHVREIHHFTLNAPR